MRDIPSKNLKINPVVVKTILDSIRKRFRKSAIRENFNLKPDQQIKKAHSNRRCNYFHQHNGEKENCIQFPSFVSEQHLSKRSNTCMHPSKFKFSPVFANQEHISGTSRATNVQVQHWVPSITLKTHFCGKRSRTSKDS